MRDNLISNAAQSERIRIELVGLDNMVGFASQFTKLNKENA